jgi:hypothetical protein
MPKITTEFVVKWSATLFALITVYLTSHDIIPLNKYMGIMTAFLWMWLGFMWKQPSMWVLNIIMLGLYINGLFRV